MASAFLLSFYLLFSLIVSFYHSFRPIDNTQFITKYLLLRFCQEPTSIRVRMSEEGYICRYSLLKDRGCKLEYMDGDKA